MLRNVASQKYRVYAWDVTTGLAKTGDAANISAYIQIDDAAGAATNDAAPSEVSSTNQPGYYDFDLTQAETNGAKVSLSPKSSTADVAVIACPPVIYTRPQYASLESIDSNGRLDIIKVAGTTQTAKDIGAAVPAAAAGASGGLLISGSNSGTTTLGALTVTGATTLTGAVSLGSTLGITGTTTLAALTCTTLTATTNAIPWNAAWDAEVQSEVADALVAYDPPTNAEMEARTILAADYLVAGDLSGLALESTLTTIAGYIDTEIQTILTNLADVPTVAEFEARTLPAADYTIVSDLGTVQTGDGYAYLVANVGANGANLTAADNAVIAAIAALNNLSPAQVNAEIVDALATDTYAEPGQGAPAATTSITAKINYLYKAWRNKKTQTSTTFSLFADDASTVDQKGTNSDDGTTTTIGEIATGP